MIMSRVGRANLNSIIRIQMIIQKAPQAAGKLKGGKKKKKETYICVCVHKPLCIQVILMEPVCFFQRCSGSHPCCYAY